LFKALESLKSSDHQAMAIVDGLDRRDAKPAESRQCHDGDHWACHSRRADHRQIHTRAVALRRD
jgi:hypothetical protein